MTYFKAYFFYTRIFRLLSDVVKLL